jgi:hypothetical protein
LVYSSGYPTPLPLTNSLEMFVDANWGGDGSFPCSCKDLSLTDSAQPVLCKHARSTTGYIATLGHNIISWKSTVQRTTALSSGEAEYIASCTAVKEVMWLRSVLNELGLKQVGATTIHEDNQGCIKLSNNPVKHGRTKHIDIQFHYQRERVAEGSVVLTYISTDKNIADIATKPLGRIVFTRLRDAIVKDVVVVINKF